MTPKDGSTCPARRCSATIALPLHGPSPVAVSTGAAAETGADAEDSVADAVEIEGDQAAGALVGLDADPEVRAVVDASKVETANQTPVN